MKKKKTTQKTTKNAPSPKNNIGFRSLSFIHAYFTTKRHTTVVTLLVFISGVILGAGSVYVKKTESKVLSVQVEQVSHWFLLQRKSNIEYLYSGIPGEKEKSKLIKTFYVKTGIPRERPTPLPMLLGKEYWLVTKKEESKENHETAPYFLTLDIPVSEEVPFGPTPYLECLDQFTNEAIQCDWELPGYFGLHGVNGDLSRLSDEDLGSSGCIRHTDEDIAYLYNLLDPEQEEIRYYIEDI